MFFVSASTGNVGGAATRRLLHLGHKVRTITRDAAKAHHLYPDGVEILEGEASDGALLQEALQNVEGAFVMLPPPLAFPSGGFPESETLADSYAQALQVTNCPRVVALSSIGAEQSENIGLIGTLRYFEQRLRSIRSPLAFIRAAAFMENIAPTFASAYEAGRWDTFFDPLDKPIPMVATKDIGRHVADLLIGPTWKGQRIVELGRETTANDVAHALETAGGTPVKARSIPQAQWGGVLKSMGLPEPAVQGFAEMEASINSGWIHFGVPGTERVNSETSILDFVRSTQKSK